MQDFPLNQEIRISVSATDEASLEEALAEAMRRLKSGCVCGKDENESSAFSFEVQSAPVIPKTKPADYLVPEMVAKAVMAACQRAVEKARSLDNINLESVIFEARKNAMITPQDIGVTLGQMLKHLRAVAIDPIDVPYGELVSIEVRPSDDDDRVLVGRKDWGYSVVNYTHEGLILDVYSADMGSLSPVLTSAILGTDLEAPAEI